MNKKHIYAISKSESQINRILGLVFWTGSSSCDICILPPGRCPGRLAVPWKESKVPEGAMIGALGVAAIGLLAGIGALFTSGMEPMNAAGPGLGALTAFVAGSSVWKIAGRVTRKGIVGLEAKCQPNPVPEGNFLICIRAVNRKALSRVKRILNEEGAEVIACPE